MSGRKRRAWCMKITTRGLFDLNGWLTSPMGCDLSCRRARGFESKRTNEPPTECRGCEVQPRVALALRGLSWFITTSHTQHATCHGSPTAPSRRREVHQTPVSAFVDSGRSASHLVGNLVWARYPVREPLVWSFFPPGRRKLPISELQPTDRKNKRVPRSVAPLGAGCPEVSRVPLFPLLALLGSVVMGILDGWSKDLACAAPSEARQGGKRRRTSHVCLPP